ncbi:MAG TPA: hypothetical protein VL463_06130 [Kofleriaceae bacterium]|nr:hypothetical protein [Kofleriaceae bacterium]
MTRTAKGRWLAPTLLALGVAVGGLGVWFMLHARPTAGDYYEVFALDETSAVALRVEQGSDRSFVELVEVGRGVRWQALIPPYAGRANAPAIAASPTAITVRVRRDDKDELWALSTEDADKLGQVELLPGAARSAVAPAVITASDRDQSFEFVGDASHATAVTAIRLADGHAQWRVDLGDDEVRDAWLDAHALWIRTARGVRGLDRETGAAATGAPSAPPARDTHRAGAVTWVPRGDHLEVIDTATGAMRARIP